MSETKNIEIKNAYGHVVLNKLFVVNHVYFCSQLIVKQSTFRMPEYELLTIWADSTWLTVQVNNVVEVDMINKDTIL